MRLRRGWARFATNHAVWWAWPPTTPMLLLCLILLLPCIAHAESMPPPLDQVQRADGALVVPDHFLRSWDPVTVFFPADTGPAQAGPEDHPEHFVTLHPPQPGAWRWLGPRVLQFRPAEPWTPLRRVQITAGTRTASLVPLLPAPVQTAPQDQPEGIANLDTISLTFRDPVDPADLARLLTIELRPLPGIDSTGSQTLTRADFDIKPLERASRADRQTYLVMLHQPLPDQRLVILRLRLSDAAGLDDPLFEQRLRTATPFTLESLDCGDGYRATTADQLTTCNPDSDSGNAPQRRSVTLAFSAPPQALDIMQARNAFRISPPVDDLKVTTDSAQPQTLHLAGSFAAETEYTLQVAPGSLIDQRGRALTGPAQHLRFAFRPVPPRLVWDASQGIVERDGPQMVPVRGHGYAHADVRIHRIDPLDRDFWPFPPEGVETRDAEAPPLPGNEPAAWTKPAAVRTADIAARIKALGSPSVSELMDLPETSGGDAKFGLDLQPLLARIAGAREPGTYLVGLRALHSPERHWIRLEVTDLSLTTVEEPGRVRFAVTSLATAQPVSGAQIRIEGLEDRDYRVLAEGTTDAQGEFTYVPHDGTQAAPQRIVVQKATDTLVLRTVPGPRGLCRRQLDQPARRLAGLALHQDRDQRAGRKTPHPVPRLHGTPDLPSGGAGRNPWLRPPLPARRTHLHHRQGHGAGAGAGQAGMALSGDAGRHQRLLLALRRQDGGDRRLHRLVPAGSRGAMRQRGLQEGSLSPADLRSAAEPRAERAARCAVPGGVAGALLRRRRRHRPADHLAGDPVPLHLEPTRPPGLPVLQRRAILRRPDVPLHAGHAEQWQDRCRRFGATHAGPHAGADSAAAHLHGGGDGHRR